jgi:hypothetical protein
MVVPSKDVRPLGCQASAGVPGAEAAIMTAPDAGTQTAPIDDVDRAIVAVLREDGRTAASRPRQPLRPPAPGDGSRHRCHKRSDHEGDN